MIAAMMVAGCAAETPPAADPEVVQAAVDRAQLEMERASQLALKSEGDPQNR